MGFDDDFCPRPAETSSTTEAHVPHINYNAQVADVESCPSWQWFWQTPAELPVTQALDASTSVHDGPSEEIELSVWQSHTR